MSTFHIVYYVLHFSFEKMFCFKNWSCSFSIFTGNRRLLYLTLLYINLFLEFSMFKKQNELCITLSHIHWKPILNVKFAICTLLLLLISLNRRKGNRIQMFSEYIHVNYFAERRKKLLWEYKKGNLYTNFEVFLLCFIVSNLKRKLEVSKLLFFLSVKSSSHGKRNLGIRILEVSMPVTLSVRQHTRAGFIWHEYSAFLSVSILQIIHMKESRLHAVFIFYFRRTTITLSIQNRLRIAKPNEVVYTSWNEIMMIKTGLREAVNLLYCVCVKLLWDSGRCVFNAKIVPKDFDFMTIHSTPKFQVL